MKTKLLLLTLFISVISFAQQYTAIPDANFENALSSYDDFPNDGQVPTANIQNLTSLDVSGQNISDLTGIQDFTALEELVVYSNQLTSLDISQNTALQYLDCEDNQITTLDISSNLSLTTLNCAVNQLSVLDVSTNTSLQGLYCFANQLTSLDLTQNTTLIALSVGGTLLSSVDLSQNVNLIYLLYYAGSNLDISHNTNLTHLEVGYSNITNLNLQQNVNLDNIKITNCNNLATLDLSSNVNLQFVNCTNNSNLSAINIKNGNNTNITYYSGGDSPGYQFFATNNPNLTCIEVDDPAWSTANWTNIDSQTSFSANCHFNETYVPDDNFENYLETHDASGNTVSVGDPNSMGNGVANDDYVATDAISGVTNLNVYNQSIADLTGIEDFTALTFLDCGSNQLTSLNVTQNINLSSLVCWLNQLTSLDISQNVALTNLDCIGNQLTSLDVTSNTSLTSLSFGSNQLNSIDVSQNTALVNLYCADNLLSNLDVSQNINLSQLFCFSNQLTNLDVSQNTSLTSIKCEDNQLTSLDLTNNLLLSNLACYNNQLTSLDIRNGNNTAFSNNDFLASNNPNLTCIIVDDATWSAANWTNIDTTSTFVNNQAECDALSIEDANFENSLSLYPNPAQDQVSLHIDRNATYSLYDINGQLLRKGNLEQGINALDLKNISQGIYFIKIADKNIRTTRKLIIK